MYKKYCDRCGEFITEFKNFEGETPIMCFKVSAQWSGGPWDSTEKRYCKKCVLDLNLFSEAELDEFEKKQDTFKKLQKLNPTPVDPMTESDMSVAN